MLELARTRKNSQELARRRRRDGERELEKEGERKRERERRRERDSEINREIKRPRVDYLEEMSRRAHENIQNEYSADF